MNIINWEAISKVSGKTVADLQAGFATMVEMAGEEAAAKALRTKYGADAVTVAKAAAEPSRARTMIQDAYTAKGLNDLVKEASGKLLPDIFIAALSNDAPSVKPDASGKVNTSGIRMSAGLYTLDVGHGFEVRVVVARKTNDEGKPINAETLHTRLAKGNPIKLPTAPLVTPAQDSGDDDNEADGEEATGTNG